MAVMDDLSRSGQMASGIQVLVQDIYHLLITQPGTMWTNAEFGIGLTDELLASYDPASAAALPDRIALAIQEDDRVDSVDVEFVEVGDAIEIDMVVVAMTGETFRLVGPISEMRAEILTANG